ncbi:hypothetical protein LSH36_274g06080 [Paralvinella palmiformis]|uniref:Domain of unknown function with conserved HDNR motif domain-containing protein n=1 Tax=Paralvinella palmiformis TaxID=53620 RepID=A0AAD9JK78_9ANNE|nr:hypothetical protein LSH36_274g06080 [Paralvinella palmiformis]
MPKGRSFAPVTLNDGIWFQHRGLPDPGPLLRDTSTNTGLMLSSPYKQSSSYYPPEPPEPYQDKHTRNFKKSNLFSAHDNRHTLQDHGVYFGDGHSTRTLGKHIRCPDDRQHWTDKDFLKHDGHLTTDQLYRSQYISQYRGEPTDEPPSKRRFPKIHPDPEPDLVKLDTDTTDWFGDPDVPHKTPTQVLASTQEPFLGTNKWKYSYHGLSRCYPSYSLNTKRHRDLLLPGINKVTGQVTDRVVGNVA